MNNRQRHSSAKLLQEDSIAVVGMACRFPRSANNLTNFWYLLEKNGSTITEVPADRWDVDKFYSEDEEVPGKMYTRKGGFLENSIRTFDAQFFGMPPREASNLDPHQRLGLEVCHEALEDAFIRPEQLRNSNTGVFFGMSYDEFNVYMRNNMNFLNQTSQNDDYK